MTELRGFWAIDVDEEPDERVREAAELLIKMDSEGGTDGYCAWGGIQAFPEELRPVAAAYIEAGDVLDEAVTKWANERGVQR